MNAARSTVFVSHGAPTLALEDSPTGRFLDALGPRLARPRAVVVASAHFDRTQATLTGHPAPRTVHDFGGFPAPLYQIRYGAPGDPALAERAHALLEQAGFPAAVDPSHGLDHGVWVPMLRMFPKADIPVVALAVNPSADAAYHLRLGSALAPLSRENVLVLGSGGYSHNLGALDWNGANAPVPAWASAFVEWLRTCIETGDSARATAWRDLAPNALRNHPTTEHLMPLFVAWGAAGPGARGRTLHRGYEMGALALDAFEFLAPD